MDIGLTLRTDSLRTRNERDFFLQRVKAGEMRASSSSGRLPDRLGDHSLLLSDHVCIGRDLGARHTANEAGTRTYSERPAMQDLVATTGALTAGTERVRLASSLLIAPYRARRCRRRTRSTPWSRASTRPR
jgi:hypothetical protein